MPTSIPASNAHTLGVRAWLITLALCCVNSAAAQANASEDLAALRTAGPSDMLTPADVVETQMAALGLNQELGDNGGIEIAFRFASPRNRAFTGPLTKFVSILRNPQYRAMLEYQSIRFGDQRTRGDEVGVPVILTMSDGARSGFVFVLSRQGGTPCTCWMTDRVVPIAVEGLEGSDDGPAGSSDKTNKKTAI